MIYIPLVLLICVATVALRYHYAVDVFVGAGLAYGALRIAEWKVRQLRGPVAESLAR